MAYLGNYPALGIFGTGNIQDFAVTPAKLSTGAPFWNSSGNFGIGTSTPGSKLDIVGGGSTGGLTVGGSIAAVRASSTVIDMGDSNRIMALGPNTTTSGTFKFIVASSNASVYTTAATIDASGNLGLGVTPSAWISKAFQMTGGALSGLSASTFDISQNAYYGASGYAYTTTGVSTLYRQDTGAHRWFTAPSGTAGNAISFTQAMTLDASGNFGLGTTSLLSFANYKTMRVGGSSTSIGLISAYDGTTDIRMSTANTGEGYVGTHTNHPVVFLTNGSERARLDTSGNLLVGTTTDGFGGILSTKTHVVSSGSRSGVASKVDSIGSAASFVAWNAADSGTRRLISFYSNSSITSVGEITSNGTNTTYSTTSDYRLKENVLPLTGALAKVSALKPCTYTWKADGSSGQGFIAHELQAVVPDCVTGEKDAVDEDGNPKYQGIDTSFLVATLTAAIQELSQIVDAQAARIATLEAA